MVGISGIVTADAKQDPSNAQLAYFMEGLIQGDEPTGFVSLDDVVIKLTSSPLRKGQSLKHIYSDPRESNELWYVESKSVHNIPKINTKKANGYYSSYVFPGTQIHKALDINRELGYSGSISKLTVLYERELKKYFPTFRIESPNFVIPYAVDRSWIIEDRRQKSWEQSVDLELYTDKPQMRSVPLSRIRVNNTEHKKGLAFGVLRGVTGFMMGVYDEGSWEKQRHLNLYVFDLSWQSNRYAKLPEPHVLRIPLSGLDYAGTVQLQRQAVTHTKESKYKTLSDLGTIHSLRKACFRWQEEFKKMRGKYERAKNRGHSKAIEENKVLREIQILDSAFEDLFGIFLGPREFGEMQEKTVTSRMHETHNPKKYLRKESNSSAFITPIGTKEMFSHREQFHLFEHNPTWVYRMRRIDEIKLATDTRGITLRPFLDKNRIWQSQVQKEFVFE